MSEIRLDGVPTRREMELRPPEIDQGRAAMPNRLHPISEPRPVQAALKDSDHDLLEFFAPSKCARGCGVPDLEAREPASRPIWLHVMQNGPGKCARSGAATKWPRRNLNLPLAARARVGHIRHNGAVAEWLKAAVC